MRYGHRRERLRVELLAVRREPVVDESVPARGVECRDACGQ